jgi:hypothetical protein
MIHMGGMKMTMLSTLKDLLGATQTAAVRVNETWGSTTEKLTQARVRLAHWEQVCGQQIADGEDAAAATKALHDAESTVRQLENAVTVLWQRKQDADADRRKAETAATRESLREKLTQLGDAGQTVQDCMDALSHAVNEYVPLAKEIMELRYDDLSFRLQSSNLLFKPRLLESCRSMPGCPTQEGLVLKQASWLSSVPQPSIVDEMKIE